MHSAGRVCVNCRDVFICFSKCVYAQWTWLLSLLLLFSRVAAALTAVESESWTRHCMCVFFLFFFIVVVVHVCELAGVRANAFDSERKKECRLGVCECSSWSVRVTPGCSSDRRDWLAAFGPLKKRLCLLAVDQIMVPYLVLSSLKVFVFSLSRSRFLIGHLYVFRWYR